MSKFEYDFLSFTSFPSSGKYVNDTEWWWWVIIFSGLNVRPGSTLRIEVNAKATDNLLRTEEGYGSYLFIKETGTLRELGRVGLPPGSYDWRKFSGEVRIPTDVRSVDVGVGVSTGMAEGRPGILWLDDLKIYMDGVLIYANDFSNWNPYIGAGIGAGVGGIGGYLATKRPEYALLAILGAIIGGTIGWLTAEPTNT